MSQQTVRLAAITADLDWAYRKTCSNERFDRALADAYIRVHVDRSIRFMEHAASLGAKLVLGPEYFRGSELFSTTGENRRLITDAVDGETTARLCVAAKKHGVYLAAAFDAQHGERVAQTGVLVAPDGKLVGHHIKGGEKSAGSDGPRYALWDTDIARLGIAVCADAEKPRAMLDMADRGMRLLLLPGCGFMGRFWREFVIVRALDLRCAVVYSDESRAMIVSASGDVLAETERANDVITADLPMIA